MENETTETMEQSQTSDSFMEGWDEAEPTSSEAADQRQQQDEEIGVEETHDTEEEHEAPTEPPEHEQVTEGAQTEPVEGGQAAADVPKTWTLNHMDETRTVSEAELVDLAQKGLDYDRIRPRYDEARPVMRLFGDFAKQAGMSVADYVSHIRTQAKQAGGMSEAEARRAVELEDREAAVAAREAEDAARQATQNQAQEASRTAESRRRADILEFQKTFPDAAKDPKSIPREVWADVNRGMSLVSAYSKHAVAQAKAAQQAAEQKAEAVTRNQKNADRSTGSMKTAGDGSKGRDPFMDGFMD